MHGLFRDGQALRREALKMKATAAKLDNRRLISLADTLAMQALARGLCAVGGDQQW